MEIEVKEEHRKEITNLMKNYDAAKAGFNAACTLLDESSRSLWEYIYALYPELVDPKNKKVQKFWSIVFNKDKVPTRLKNDTIPEKGNL